MENKMYSYIKKQNMIEENDFVVIGVSGGADSICLFYLLLEMQKRIHFTMSVVHVNHNLRKEAVEEARFVENLCKKYQIPCKVVSVQVAQIAKNEKISTEEAGRKVRYESFDNMFVEMQANTDVERKGKIAIAHHKNDCAETVLFHLFRGTGLQGLSGILPVNGKIIRPLLCLERNEIEAYLKKRKIEYCMDLSNEGDIYTRNRIRHHIIPYAEESVCENIVPHICDTADMVQETQDFIKKIVEKEKINSTKRMDENQILIREKEFAQLHAALKNELIREILFEIARKKKDISRCHVLDIRELFKKQVGKKVTLPYQIQAIRTYEGVILSKKTEEIFYHKPMKLKIGSNIDPILGEISIEIFKRSKKDIIPEKKCTKWFDYDKIVKCLILRTRISGDYFTINQQESKKTLKEYMINEKIPQEQRDQVLLIADGNHIIWAVGHRISQTYKVTEDTKTIIKIEIIKGS